jgi:proteasome lid subunit RPN8/RPN11
MSPSIELFRGESLARVNTLPLATVLRSGLEPILGRPLAQAQFTLRLFEVPDEPRLDGQPIVDNLLPQFGYANVLVTENQRLIYRHPHTVRELIAQPLQAVLQEAFPGEPYWGFRIRGEGLPLTLARPAPLVRGVVSVGPYADGESPSFGVRRVPEPDPPLRTLQHFSITANGDKGSAFVKVLVQEQVARDLAESRSFSNEVEEGGFLLGRAYRDQEAEGTFLLEVTDALTARHTGASLLHFTFTGDSFQAVKQALRERSEESLLGWYHTHLFPASSEMGLSSIDLRLHFTTFRKPWQLAGLVNLDGNSHRTLRFYVRQADTMALCPQWIVGDNAA